jgi:hypothetical protein
LEEVGQLPCNGYSSELRHVFTCTDARPVGHNSGAESDEIEVGKVSIDVLRALLRNGEMTVTDAGYLALDALQLLHHES